MISPLHPRPLADPVPLLSEDRLRSLARTYDRATSPVWIHDLRGECIYANQPAEGAEPERLGVLVFDIVDHRGHTIGQLKTASN